MRSLILMLLLSALGGLKRKRARMMKTKNEKVTLALLPHTERKDNTAQSEQQCESEGKRKERITLAIRSFLFAPPAGLEPATL